MVLNAKSPSVMSTIAASESSLQLRALFSRASDLLSFAPGKLCDCYVSTLAGPGWVRFENLVRIAATGTGFFENPIYV